jgi:hypothetical protein
MLQIGNVPSNQTIPFECFESRLGCDNSFLINFTTIRPGELLVVFMVFMVIKSHNNMMVSASPYQ